jgi:vancomycin resistance protein YoaR
MVESPRSRPSARKETASRKRRRKRQRLLTVAGIGAVIFLLLLAFLIDAALYSGKVHAGVVVSGLHLGGMKPGEAKAALDDQVNATKEVEVTLTGGGKTWKVSAADAGLKVDTAATVAAAMAVSRKSNFFVDRFRGFLMYLKDKRVPLAGSVDKKKAGTLVTDISKAVDVPAVNAGLVFDGAKIKIVKGQKGLIVDQTALTAQLSAALLSLKASELAVPMTVKDPTVVADDFDQALQQAAVMTGSAATLTNGDDSWTLNIDDIIAYMDFRTESKNGVSVLVPFVSKEKMAPFLETLASKVKSNPVNASFKGDGTRAWVVPAVAGKKLDPDKTVEAVNAAVTSATQRTAEVALSLKEPSFTTEEAKAMGIKDVLGSYKTEWVGTPDRQVNVKITTQYTNNVILAPGEIFNFDDQIGPRTVERGYKMAPGIVRPGQLEDVLGGGICQVATTLFNAAYEAGLDIVQRKNHSIYISHYPKGRDATVSVNGPNLRFRNDTKDYILIRGSSDGITTKFVIYGTDDGREVSSEYGEDFYDVEERTVESTVNRSLPKGASSLVDAGQDGKKFKVVRTVTAASGKVLHKDVFISIWPMLPTEIEYGPKTTTATTSKTTTTSGSTDTTSKPTTTSKSTTTSGGTDTTG